ncbi:MAG: hypothetical protein K2X68_04040 [Novosphingobium sp.]|nr:hypothetical protein [Novosphingobium sp.]
MTGLRRPVCAIVGCGGVSSKWTNECEAMAVAAGRAAAQAGFLVLTGGHDGVMSAAARGAKLSGGVTMGILRSERMADCNQWTDIVIPTGMGIARNVAIALACDVMLALPGGHGTLQEVSVAIEYGRRVLCWRNALVAKLGEQIDIVSDHGTLAAEAAEVGTWLVGEWRPGWSRARALF